MKFAQLHMLVSICENDLNVSQAARSLDQAQSAVSKQVQLFEKELEQQIFVRRGKRLTALTPFGREILEDARRIIVLEEQIRIKANEHAHDTVRGELRIGTTHLQAKHVLPKVVQEFRRVYPNVFLQIHQSNPRTIFDMLTNNRVDIGICTEVLGSGSKDLKAERAYSWNRCLVVTQGHPLEKPSRLTLKDLAAHPLVTYVHGFTGRGAFDETFEAANLIPNVVFSASDSDVIKTYVGLGMGAGVIAEQAYDEKADNHLVSRDLSHLFPEMHTQMAWRRDKYPSAGFSKFISIFRERVSEAHHSGA